MRFRSIIIALIIASLPVAFMYRTLVLGRPLVRDDASSMVYPIFHALDAHLAQGDLYLWDARQWCGLPALAGGETTALYPPTLALCALLPWAAALHASYWLHLALALAGVYWVARNLGASRGGALVGAVAFTFSGYQAAHLIHHGHITALAHMPLMLAVLQTALVRDRPRWWALLAAEIALASISSHPMLFVMALTVSLLWLLFGHDWNADGAPAYSRLLPLMLALIVAGLLATPQLLPTLELATAQGRVAAADVDMAVERIASYAFRARDLPRVLLPSIDGTVHRNILGGGPEWHETNPFTGAAPLLLGIAGAIVAFRRRGWGFCLAIFAVGAVLMPAEGNPLHATLARLPFWGSFRATGRWMVLPILSLSLLSALAVTYLSVATRRRRVGAGRAVGVLTALIMVSTIILWLVFGVDGDGRLWLPGQGGNFPLEVAADALLNAVTSWEPLLLVGAAAITWIVVARQVLRDTLRGVGILALLVAVMAPQWYLWQQTNLTAPREFYTRIPRTASVARSGRIMTLPPDLITPQWQTPGSTRDERLMAGRELLTPALGAVWGVRYAGGYLQGLVPPTAQAIWEASNTYGIQSFAGGTRPDTRAVERYGTPVERMKRIHRLSYVHHIVTTGAIDDPDLKPAHEGIVNVYTYADPPPRWWLAREAVAIADPEAQLEAIKRLEFDPDRQVILDREVKLGADTVDALGSVTLLEERPAHLTLSVDCPQPRLLVLADTWYPGWKVEVDGEQAELLRANYAFRGVGLPAGEHEVTFSFRPVAWSTALPMFAIGLLMLIALLVWPTREPAREGLIPPRSSRRQARR